MVLLLLSSECLDTMNAPGYRRYILTSISHPCCELTRQQHHSQQRCDEHTGETGSPPSSHDFTSSSPAKTKHDDIQSDEKHKLFVTDVRSKTASVVKTIFIH